MMKPPKTATANNGKYNTFLLFSTKIPGTIPDEKCYNRLYDIEKFPMQDPTSSRTVKQIYLDLMKGVVVEPRVTKKDDFRGINFKPIWKGCKLSFLDPSLKTFRFKLAHEILMLNDRLHRLGIVRSDNCTFCKHNNINIKETVEHFFLYCPEIITVWEFVKPILLKLCNHRLKIDRESILLGTLPQNMSKSNKELVHYVVTLAMYSAKEARYQKINQARSASALEIFKRLLIFRIRVDYNRNFVNFYEYWAKNNAFCRINQNDGSLDGGVVVCT